MWKTIKENPLYEVSREGEVKRIDSGHTLTCFLFKNKYKYVTMSFGKKGSCKNLLVHRLVAKAFIDNPEDKKCVNHIDGNRGNNEVSNLEWVTHKENSRHAVETGLIKIGKDSYLYGVRGSAHPCSKSNLGNTHAAGRTNSPETLKKMSNSALLREANKRGV